MRHTPKQKALLISASTLVLLTTSPFAAQAKDGKKDGNKEAKTSQTSQDSKPKTEEVKSTTPKDTRAPEAKKDEQKKDEKKSENNNGNNNGSNGENKDEDRDEDKDEHGTSTIPPTVTTTTAPGTVTTTTAPSVTTTSKPPVTTTTKPGSTTTTTKVATPMPLIRASQVFLATKTGSPIRMDTTITNDAATPSAVSVVITLTSGSLPHFLEAKALTGTWSCSAYAEIPVSPQKYTCTGTLAAKTSGVITVSSGSMISAPAAGQSVIAGVVVSPSGVAAGATATFS
jgi:hypothetical protein